MRPFALQRNHWYVKVVGVVFHVPLSTVSVVVPDAFGCTAGVAVPTGPTAAR